MAGAEGEATAGRSLFIHALGIALHTTVEEGGRWYASTHSLQAVCLELCMACRACWNFSSGPVMVTADTPRRLWLRDNSQNKKEAPQKHRRRVDALRVPPLIVHALKVVELPERIQARLIEGDRRSRASQSGRLARAYRLWLWRFRQRPLWWRDTLEELTFGGEFNQPIAGIVWPVSLLELTFGRDFNQPILGVVWPASLRRLSFGDGFDQPVVGAVWPVGLQQLSFGHCFNEPIAGVVWPASLQQLSFRNGTMFQDAFNKPYILQHSSGYRWCGACIQHMMLGSKFNKGIIRVVWPGSLQQLSFGDYFNQPIVGVVWPASLQRLSFGRFFNQPIAGVVWPASLRQLSFRNGSMFADTFNHLPAHLPASHCCGSSTQEDLVGSKFNQPIVGVVWPASLQQLSFGRFFNQPIVGVVWPASLQTLSFGKNFNQPIDAAVWPASLRHLSFGDDFNLPVVGAAWPDSLQTLSFGKKFNQPIAEVVWPASLRLRIVWGDRPCKLRVFGRGEIG
ncbi:unnamed protein product [Pylaiella littoralis]